MLALGPFGCFGDWVSAKPRPQQKPTAAEGGDEAPAADSGQPLPEDPCAAYRHTIANRCDAVLSGRPDQARCHAQLVRVMALYEQPQPPPPATCAQRLAAMPASDSATESVELGPDCEAWATAIRNRCIAPLRDPTAALTGCGPDLLAFESTLDALAYAPADAYQAQCAAAVERLTTAP